MPDGPAPKTLDEALLIVQANRPKLVKSKVAEIPTKSGKDYTYGFADLATVADAIMPMLSDLGVLWQTWVGVITTDGQFRRVLHWRLKHVASGEEMRDLWPLAGENPQAVGSGITFGRRYCLVAATGLTPEDDDDAVAAMAEQAAEFAAGRGTARRAQADRRRPAPTGGTAQRAQRQPSSGQPAGRPPLPQEHAGVTRPQLTTIRLGLDELGVTTRDDKIGLVTMVVGRPLESSTELTQQEAHQVITAIEQAKSNPDPGSALWQNAAALAEQRAAEQPPDDSGAP